MKVDLTNPIFHDEDKAREHFESSRWPDGPFCPHCGETENVLPPAAARAIVPDYSTAIHCEQAFTVTVGSVMERSHIPAH